MEPDSRLDTAAGSTSPNSVQHDFVGDQTASLAVIETVAAVSGTEPTALPTLYDAVNPDALDALFEPHDRRIDSDLRVEFSYAGFDVVVRDGLEVTVHLEGAAE